MLAQCAFDSIDPQTLQSIDKLTPSISFDILNTSLDSRHKSAYNSLFSLPYNMKRTIFSSLICFYITFFPTLHREFSTPDIVREIHERAFPSVSEYASPTSCMM
jgi:hypothetical protein